MMALSSSKRFTVDATSPQRKKTTEEHLEKRAGEEKWT